MSAQVNTQAKPSPAPAKAAVAQAAKPQSPVAPSRRRGLTPLTPMRKATAKSMRKLADQVQESHPDMITHEHLRDAAKQVEAGNEDEAQGHLRAAMFSLTPQSLMRNGLHTDDSHQTARQVMDGVHRHLLLTKGIASVAAKNQAAIARAGTEDDTAPRPAADPNAGYGPGALAQKPTVRQPPGDQALNAPATADGGGSDPAVADPDGLQPKGSKQFTARDEAGRVLDLIGPGGFQHGWKPGGPTAADHDKAAKLHTQAAAKAKDPAAKAKHMQRSKAHTQIARKLRALAPASPAVSAGLAYGWGDVSAAIEFSVKTAALEATPAPRGKPGGGLYDVTGLEHTPYFQNLVKALIEKRGMPSDKAYAIAYGALRKWSKGGGKVHPEVSAAATGALAGEKAAGATAKAAHGHAVTWHDIDVAIELAAAPPPAAGSTAKQQAVASEARVAAGNTGGGQFTAGGGGQPAKGKTAASAPAKPDAHQQHVAHVAHELKVSTGKAKLLVSAQDDRAQASALIKQRNVLAKELASASGKTSSGQAGSTTSANSTTSSSAPAAASSTTAAAPASTSTTAASTSKTSTSASTSATSAAGLKTQIAALNVQINGLLQAAAQATAQAAKMK